MVNLPWVPSQDYSIHYTSKQNSRIIGLHSLSYEAINENTNLYHDTTIKTLSQRQQKPTYQLNGPMLRNMSSVTIYQFRVKGKY